MPQTTEELNAALRKMDKKHRFYNYLIGLGASLEAANLIASSEDEAKRFEWDGVLFKARGSDVPAVDDPAVKDYFLKGPFAALFPKAKEPTGDDHPEIDPAVLAAVRAGNQTARALLARDRFNGDVQAVDAIVAGKGNSDDKRTTNNGGSAVNGGSVTRANNPFLKLRKPDGSIDKAVEKQIGTMIAAMGHKKVADIARAAKSEAAPLGLSLTGVPLKA